MTESPQCTFNFILRICELYKKWSGQFPSEI